LSGFRFEISVAQYAFQQKKDISMSQDNLNTLVELRPDFEGFAEEILAGALAAVIRQYEHVGHMPEHAIYQAMLRLQAAAPRACSLAGITDSIYQEFAKFEVKYPL
jgi:hypothetical protein